MADLDAELLALAGDSSDDEGAKPADKLVKPNSSPSPRASSTPNINESSEKKSLGVTKPGMGSNGAARKTAKKSRANESEEEGEA
jgi:hypothetical protein